MVENGESSIPKVTSFPLLVDYDYKQLVGGVLVER